MADRFAAALGYREPEKFAGYAKEVMRACRTFRADAIRQATEALVRRSRSYPKIPDILDALREATPSEAQHGWRYWGSAKGENDAGETVIQCSSEFKARELGTRYSEELNLEFGVGRWRICVAGQQTDGKE